MFTNSSNQERIQAVRNICMEGSSNSLDQLLMKPRRDLVLSIEVAICILSVSLESRMIPKSLKQSVISKAARISTTMIIYYIFLNSRAYG